jgi:hypothetical protein
VIKRTHRGALICHAGYMLRIVHHPHGPRLYICGLRCHHGISGSMLALAAFAAHQRRVAAVCVIWAASDWRDFPFTDKCNH